MTRGFFLLLFVVTIPLLEKSAAMASCAVGELDGTDSPAVIESTTDEPVSGGTSAQSTSLAETYLHQGKFAEGETAVLLALDSKPDDDSARFGLGVIQFFRAVENLGQSLYEYGAITEKTNVPFLRLPVPKNENPSTINYRALGRVLDAFATDLQRAESTLAGIKDDNVKLSLRLAEIQFDFTGLGKQHTKLIDLLKAMNRGQQFDFQKQNPDFKINFDRGDVAWLRAYCHLLSAMVNVYRAVNEEPGFESRVDGIFPKIEKSRLGKVPNWQDGLSITDAPRLRRARLQLISVCELNRETWRHIRAETDDDFEWLPNSKQTDQVGLPISNDQVNAWLGALTELESLLKGESLIPSSLLIFIDGDDRHVGKGLNVKRLLDDPPLDLLNLKRLQDKGIDAKYLEEEKGRKVIDIAKMFLAFQLFDGPFAFGRAARMN